MYVIIIIASIVTFLPVVFPKFEVVDSATSTGRAATYVVAAFNSSTKAKSQADYVCDSIADNVQLQTAIDTTYSSGGGTVVCHTGDYYFASTIIVKPQVSLYFLGSAFASRVFPTANIDVFRMQTNSSLSGVYIETLSPVIGFTFTKSVILLDGADKPTQVYLQDVLLRGDVGNGTGIYAIADAEEENVTFTKGVNVDIRGFEYGVCFKSATNSGIAYINESYWLNTTICSSVYNIYLEKSGIGGNAVRGHSFYGHVGALNATESLIYCNDSFNHFVLTEDNWGAGQGLYAYQLIAPARGNVIEDYGYSLPYLDTGLNNKVTFTGGEL